MRTIDALNGEWSVECIGCAIVSKEATPIGGLIKETPNFVLHQDPKIPIKNFLIIATKNHIKSIAELSKNKTLNFLNYVTMQEKRLNHLMILLTVS